ncbi:MAG: hypothetical protein EA401_13470 [Planctomycetota bacterium]|nr:MAG: hypothetical protein EA401_13470 [Planctomycetota bacterium]
MAKGSVITQQLVEALGLASVSFVLKAPLRNTLHPELQDPMFTIQVEEYPETIYLDRQYCFDHQFSVPSGYGTGDRILLWMRRVHRHRNNDPSQPATTVLMASDCFLYDQSREFQRFRLFLRSKRILDSQARDFLARNGEHFGTLVQSSEGITKILSALGHIAEWPDPENGFRRHSSSDATLEGLAKNYAAPLLTLRNAKNLPAHILRLDPEQRANVFRLLCHVPDQQDGSQSLIVFLRDMGAATNAQAVIRRTHGIKTGADLSRAIDTVRQFLTLPLG